jgi:integrase
LEDLRAVFAVILSPLCSPLEAPFRLALTTGMRRGWLCGLRWRDVDLDNGSLQIEQTLLAPRYQLVVSEPKSESA